MDNDPYSLAGFLGSVQDTSPEQAIKDWEAADRAFWARLAAVAQPTADPDEEC